jgi:hypothetical protein
MNGSATHVNVMAALVFMDLNQPKPLEGNHCAAQHKNTAESMAFAFVNHYPLGQHH